MSLVLPSSIQQTVGHQLLRVAVSHDASRFLFDIVAARENARRTRYSYRLIDGRVTGSKNINNLIGYTVDAVYLVIPASGPAKIVFETNPNGSKVERSIIYIEASGGAPGDESSILQEDGFNLLQEDGASLILLEDQSLTIDDVELEDFNVGKNLFNPNDSETKFFIVHEDDF